MRFIAIDLGDKRTGVALGDDETCLAAPLLTLECPLAQRDGLSLIERLVRAVDDAAGLDAGRVRLVLGLPLNMDGTRGPRAKLAERFAARLASASGLVVMLVDERRTTMDADARLARSGLTHGQKKARRDAIAAAAVLDRLLSGEAEVVAEVLPGVASPEPGSA